MRGENPVIDMQIALQNTAGDREMLDQMAELFIDKGPKQLLAVETMIGRGDCEGIRVAAHTLKGSISIFGAASAELAAARIEQIGASSDLTDVGEAWESLAHEFRRLTEAIHELLGQDRSGPSFDEAS